MKAISIVGGCSVGAYGQLYAPLMRWNDPLPKHQSAKNWSLFQRHKMGAVP